MTYNELRNEMGGYWVGVVLGGVAGSLGGRLSEWGNPDWVIFVPFVIPIAFGMWVWRSGVKKTLEEVSRREQPGQPS